MDPIKIDMKPKVMDFEFVRGDAGTVTITLTDQATGQPFVLTGFTITLTVNSEFAPADTSNEIFSLPCPVTDGAGGVFNVPITAAETDQEPGVYYHDMFFSGPSFGRTLFKGEFEICQDIGK